jgi:hypothetical protein
METVTATAIALAEPRILSSAEIDQVSGAGDWWAAVLGAVGSFVGGFVGGAFGGVSGATTGATLGGDLGRLVGQKLPDPKSSPATMHA